MCYVLKCILNLPGSIKLQVLSNQTLNVVYLFFLFVLLFFITHIRNSWPIATQEHASLFCLCCVIFFAIKTKTNGPPIITLGFTVYKTKNQKNKTKNKKQKKNTKTKQKNTGRNLEAQEVLQQMSRMNKTSLPQGKLENTNDMLMSYGSTDCENILQKRGRITDIFVPAYRLTSVLLLISYFFTVFGYYGISFVSERYFKQLTEDNGLFIFDFFVFCFVFCVAFCC